MTNNFNDKIIEIINGHGRFEDFYKFNKFEMLKNNFKDHFNIDYDEEKIFKYICLNFEIYNQTKSKGNEINQKLSLEYPYCIYKKEELKLFSDEQKHKNFILCKNFYNLLDYDKKLYTINNIKKKYGNFSIDVVEQNPYAYGFQIFQKNLYQNKISMTINEYIDYQSNFENKKLDDIKHIEKIKFGVNIDLFEWKELLNDLEKNTPPEIYCLSEYDMLKHMTKHIPGITIPQIYLKVAGCWTGGHEENLRIRAININNGPGVVEWFCINQKNVELFRKKVKEKYDWDIHKRESLWFCPLEFCIENDIPVCNFIQFPGDLLILGPGTLHWVRSHENTINTAWNLCNDDLYQYQIMKSRYDINKEVNFRNIIPFKLLILNLINILHHKISLENYSYLLELLKEFIEKQKIESKCLINRNDICIEDDDLENNNITNCNICFDDIFSYWGYIFYDDDNYEIWCLKCYLVYFEKNKKKDENEMLLIKKFDIDFLDNFIKKHQKNYEERKNGVNENIIDESIYQKDFYIKNNNFENIKIEKETQMILDCDKLIKNIKKESYKITKKYENSKKSYIKNDSKKSDIKNDSKNSDFIEDSKKSILKEESKNSDLKENSEKSKNKEKLKLETKVNKNHKINQIGDINFIKKKQQEKNRKELLIKHQKDQHIDLGTKIFEDNKKEFLKKNNNDKDISKEEKLSWIKNKLNNFFKKLKEYSGNNELLLLYKENLNKNLINEEDIINQVNKNLDNKSLLVNLGTIVKNFNKTEIKHLNFFLSYICVLTLNEEANIFEKIGNNEDLKACLDFYLIN